MFRAVMWRASILLGLACASCGRSQTAAPDASFAPAAHPSLARGNIPDHGGPTLAHARIVTVTFAGYEHEPDVEAFGGWLPTSDWWATVGAEYGIGAATSLGHVVLASPAPASTTVSELGALLAARIKDGTLPSDPDTSIEADTVYVVYFPASTSVHVTAGDAGCGAASGFHASYSDGQLLFVFAAIPGNCAATDPSLGLSDLEFLEFNASHEIFEAVTDPYLVATNGSALATGPAAWDLQDRTNPWLGLGGELGDACTAHCVRDAGFTVQRIWSNAAALAGDDPCVPAVEPAFGVAPVQDAAVMVAAGSSAQVPVVGWASAPAAPWQVNAYAAPFVTSSFVPTASLDPEALDNGATGTLVVSVPTGTSVGAQGYVFLTSQAANGAARAYSGWQVWPLLVIAQ
jgi:hypothetical protein